MSVVIKMDERPDFMTMLLIADDPPGTWNVEAISARIDEPLGFTRAVVDDLMESGFVRWCGYGEYLAPTYRGMCSIRPYIGYPRAEA